jgi:hypothetical protein
MLAALQLVLLPAETPLPPQFGSNLLGQPLLLTAAADRVNLAPRESHRYYRRSRELARQFAA